MGVPWRKATHHHKLGGVPDEVRVPPPHALLAYTSHILTTTLFLFPPSFLDFFYLLFEFSNSNCNATQLPNKIWINTDPTRYKIWQPSTFPSTHKKNRESTCPHSPVLLVCFYIELTPNFWLESKDRERKKELNGNGLCPPWLVRANCINSVIYNQKGVGPSNSWKGVDACENGQCRWEIGNYSLLSIDGNRFESKKQTAKEYPLHNSMDLKLVQQQ